MWVYHHSNLCSVLQNTHLFCNRVRFGRSRSSRWQNKTRLIAGHCLKFRSLSVPNQCIVVDRLYFSFTLWHHCTKSSWNIMNTAQFYCHAMLDPSASSLCWLGQALYDDGTLVADVPWRRMKLQQQAISCSDLDNYSHNLYVHCETQTLSLLRYGACMKIYV